jgi:hypothetical protein
MNYLKTLFSLLIAAWLSGCAHPIVISPDPSTLPVASEKIAKNVGFVISADDRTREIVSPGGGGDNVSYVPYRDLEFGLYSTLSAVFNNAIPLASQDDKKAISAQELNLIFVPKIQTTSSSESMFTWPPTYFSIMLDYTLLDAAGVQVTSGRVMAEGRAEFSEFKSDFALSAKRAGSDLFNKLKSKLLTTPELKN